MNRLKLRAAYGGEAGTFAAFGSLYTVYQSTLVDGNVGIVVPLTQGNPEISPERQKELEIGFDLGVLDERLGLEFTWYQKGLMTYFYLPTLNLLPVSLLNGRMQVNWKIPV